MKRCIAVDFDGTLCENKYPKIGAANTALIDQLKEEKKNGTALILWTCRQGKQLEAAVRWCKKQGLTFNTVNQNLKERIRAFHGDTRKISADIYIEDRAAIFTFGEKLELGGGG